MDPNAVWSLFSLCFSPFVNYNFQHSQSSRKRCKDAANATPEGCFNTCGLFVLMLYILLFVIIFFYVWYSFAFKSPLKWLYQLTLVTCQLPRNRLILRQNIEKFPKKNKKCETSMLFPKLWNALFVSTVEMMILYRWRQHRLICAEVSLKSWLVWLMRGHSCCHSSLM